MTVAALAHVAAPCWPCSSLLTLTFVVLFIGFLSESVADFEANDTSGSGSAAGSASSPRSLAWYASFAAVTNSTFKRTVLPTFPR